MKISMHTMAVDSFEPMLKSLSAILDKGVAYTSISVTACDILRHKRVVIGKQDYLSQVGSLIRSRE